MRTPPTNLDSLWNALSASDNLSGRFLAGGEARVAWSDLVAGSVLGDARSEELGGKSVLIVTAEQLTAAAALVELDGLAWRMVLYPPDLPLDYVPFVVEAAGVDAVVSDLPELGSKVSGLRHFRPSLHNLAAHNRAPNLRCRTEWVLLTSGTVGPPKLVVHSLASLTGAIASHPQPAAPIVWSTFYDIRRYGGLQIFLRAALGGTSLVLGSVADSPAEFLARASQYGVTHISGTPSHWRRALMSPAARSIDPDYVRLSGEIADQAILNRLRSIYPKSKIGHAFATTEAGVAFSVDDGLAGFPAGVLDGTPEVEMKVENGTLRIRSSRTASRYFGAQVPDLKNADGFVDTGDTVEPREGRYHFVGRRDGLINVGGLKVHPEEVEAVLNRHPQVHMSLVRAKKNPVTGAVVIADVVLRDMLPTDSAVHQDSHALQNDILLFCRATLSSHKVPAAIHFVPALAVAESGKIMRRHA